MAQKQEVSKGVGKIASTDLLGAELPQTFTSLKNAIFAKCKKPKYNKMFLWRGLHRVMTRTRLWVNMRQGLHLSC